VITGFNTDIKHAERVYHVQTEDRGLANPIVESLVYVGGEILLSKKSPYKDLMHGDRVDETALREMMDLQHRRVIEAIHRGRLDSGRVGEVPPDWADEDTFPSSQKLSPAARAAAAAILSVPSEPLPAPRSKVPPASLVEPPAPSAAPAAAMPAAFAPRPAPAPPVTSAPAPAPSAPRPAASGPLPRVAPPAAPAPAATAHAAPAPAAPGATASRPSASGFRFHVPPSSSGHGMAKTASSPQSPVHPVTSPLATRSLEHVIADYLASVAASEHLKLSLLLGGELVAGESLPLTVRATTSLTDKPVPNTQISIRVDSTTRPPQLLFHGTTGGDGFVKTTVSLPDIGAGNATLVVAASSPLGSNEVSQLIQRKR
jgi:hypothetical protein